MDEQMIKERIEDDLLCDGVAVIIERNFATVVATIDNDVIPLIGDVIDSPEKDSDYCALCHEVMMIITRNYANGVFERDLSPNDKEKMQELADIGHKLISHAAEYLAAKVVKNAR